ncbi:MAG TPA: glycosyltransferase family 4 protein [Pseudolabrys sp.]|nr:glycosyltransferase family 4 protein [Pseudolabrys sp.]
MPQLNILHVFRAPLGGLFRHVLDLVQGQIARGHKVGLVFDNLTGDARSAAAVAALLPQLALGMSTVAMPRQLNANDVRALAHVSRRVRDSGAGVVHGHGAKGGAYARLAVAGRPIVRAYTPHGGSLLLDHARRSGRAYLTLERMLMQRGDLYLFESAFSADVFGRKIGAPRGLVRVVPNGVSRAEFTSVPITEDATDIVFVGEFRRVKGIDVLIEAIASLHALGSPLTATLVGDGPERAALRGLVAEKDLDRSIRFAPAMPMRQALALGRLMVLPSRAESFPYVVLETAAAGRPMITTAVGGVSEIYGGLSKALVRPDDPAALAAAIATVMCEPDQAIALADALRTRVADRFSVDAMVDGVISGYRQAIDGAPLMSRQVWLRA